MYDILECDRRPTEFGEALYVRIHRKDMAVMGFRELWEVFDQFYPGKWALQVFPDRQNLIDQANKYHLFVYDRPIDSLDLGGKPPKGTKSVVNQVAG